MDNINHETALKRPYRKKNSLRYYPYIFILPFALTFLIFNIYPILYSFYLSMTNWDGFGEIRFIYFDNYIRLFSGDPFFYKSIVNTFIIVAGYLPLQIIVALILAYLICSKRIGNRGRGIYQTTIFLPFITAPIAIGIIFSLIFSWKSGIANDLLMRIGFLEDGINWMGDPLAARIITIAMIFWKYIGYTVIIFITGMLAIPQDNYDAAEVDGASSVQIFTKIVIPLLNPLIFFVIITGLSGGFQLFDDVFALSGGGAWSGRFSPSPGAPDYSLLTIVWNIYDTAFGGTTRYGYAAAISYSLFMLISILTLLMYKLFYRKESP